MDVESKVTYMHIKEFAERLSTSPRAIRLYEEQGLIHPKKHKDNEYRLFTEQDAWRLQTILLLRETGMSLKDIRNVLQAMDQNGKDTVANHLELQRATLYTQWIELSHAIETTERVVEGYERTGGFADDTIQTLAGSLKRIRDSRETAEYQWNFDDRAPTFDQQVLDVKSAWSIYAGYDSVLDAIVKHVRPVAGEQGLELAVGTGNLSAKFVAMGAKMSGVDQSFEMLRRCRIKCPNVVTKLGNMLAAPFYSGVFDFIVSSYAFHLLTDEQQLLALREVDRLLRAGGRLCIADHMFIDSEHRKFVTSELEEQGDKQAIQAIKTHNFAEVSRLNSWLESHDYMVHAVQLNESVHLITACKSP